MAGAVSASHSHCSVGAVCDDARCIGGLGMSDCALTRPGHTHWVHWRSKEVQIDGTAGEVADSNCTQVLLCLNNRPRSSRMTAVARLDSNK